MREVERHAGERRDRVVVKGQVTARQHQVCQRTCGPLTEAALCQPQGVPFEVTSGCASRTATAAGGGVHAPREQAQGVCWDLRGPHSPQGSRKSHAGERRDRVVVQVQVPTRKHQVGQSICHSAYCNGG